MSEKYLSMKEAAKISPYEQDYLSLLARRGELKAKKIGRNWFTSVEWLNEYIGEKKPNQIIPAKKAFSGRILAIRLWLGLLVFSAIFFASYLVWEKNRAVSQENSQKQAEFIPEEIIKIPNENGGYDVYSGGRVKIGEEEKK
ncbi:MAG: hypothetical protein WAV73_01730 [Candidatus Moraniibacteriota bacterium]